MLQWISVAISGMCAAASAISLLTLLRHRTESMERMSRELTADVKECLEKLNAITVMVKVSIAEQGVINHMTTKAIESLEDSLHGEKHG